MYEKVQSQKHLVKCKDGGGFKVAVLTAMIFALACFVSCDNNSGGSSSSGGDDASMNATVELTGTTNPTFKDGATTTKDDLGDCDWEMTISGTTATIKWLDSSSFSNAVVDIYENGKIVGEIDFQRGSDKDRKNYLKATWKPSKNGGSDPGNDPGNEPGNDPGNEPGNEPGNDPVTPSEPEENENIVATYHCAKPNGSTDSYTFSFTIKFDNENKFSVTRTYNGTSKEVSKGSYTGDPSQDGDIVFKVENYVDYGNINKWENKTINDQNITITDGKGEFNIWKHGVEEFTRQ